MGIGVVTEGGLPIDLGHSDSDAGNDTLNFSLEN
jgi:hypothetical protein